MADGKNNGVLEGILEALTGSTEDYHRNKEVLVEIANALTGESKTVNDYGRNYDVLCDIRDNIGGGSEPIIEALSITANGTYTAASGVDGYSPVTVNVPNPSTGTLTISANGNYDVSTYAAAAVSVSGGGASNIVTGTFTGTTAGSVLEVPLDYSGSGYPIAVLIYPDEGPYNEQGQTFYGKVQQYAIQEFIAVKSKPSVSPSYTGTGTGMADNATTVTCYKSTSYNTYKQNETVKALTYSQTEPSASASLAVTLQSATSMSVFIASASYGFRATTPYRYFVLYSE